MMSLTQLAEFRQAVYDIRYHLNKIDDFEELEKQVNQALKSRVPKGIKNGHLKLAIDLNLIPYYGKPSNKELPYIYRSEAKSGTCSFYAYATLYVLMKGKRVTLAIKGVRSLDTSVAIITYLLKGEMVVYPVSIIPGVVFLLKLCRFLALSIILTLFRADGTTPAQRLFGQTFPYLFEWVVDDLGDLPLPRKSSRITLLLTLIW